jgi:vacuolar-type H+-ATPase subunit H
MVQKRCVRFKAAALTFRMIRFILSAMEEVVEEILKKEAEAEKIVEEAKKRAQEIAREGDQKASSINEQAKKKSHEAYTRKVNEAEKDARARYEKALQEIEGEKNSLVARKKGHVDEAASEIIGHLFSSDLPQEA